MSADRCPSHDVDALAAICRELEKLTPKMRRTTLLYAWDRYVRHGDVKREPMYWLGRGVRRLAGIDPFPERSN